MLHRDIIVNHIAIFLDCNNVESLFKAFSIPLVFILETILHFNPLDEYKEYMLYRSLIKSISYKLIQYRNIMRVYLHDINDEKIITFRALSMDTEYTMNEKIPEVMKIFGLKESEYILSSVYSITVLTVDYKVINKEIVSNIDAKTINNQYLWLEIYMYRHNIK